MHPNDRIAVTLEAAAWETILRVLSDAPYRIVAPLVQSIQAQCLAPNEVAAIGQAHGGNTVPDPLAH